MSAQELFDRATPYIFIAFELACCVAIIWRFRGSLGAFLGGLAFGLWAVSGITREVLTLLEVEWWEYSIVFRVVAMIAYPLLFAALLTGRTSGYGGAGTVPVIDELPPEEAHLAGISGWLICPAIGFILGPLAGIALFVFAVVLYPDVADAGYGELYVGELLVEALVILFTLFVAFHFFGRKRNAPRLIVILLLLKLGLGLMILFVELGLGAEDFAVESTKQLARNFVSTAIWVPYFIVSKRVKATFTR